VDVYKSDQIGSAAAGIRSFTMIRSKLGPRSLKHWLDQQLSNSSRGHSGSAHLFCSQIGIALNLPSAMPFSSIAFFEDRFLRPYNLTVDCGICNLLV
jgi:hypothetical protein